MRPQYATLLALLPATAFAQGPAYTLPPTRLTTSESVRFEPRPSAPVAVGTGAGHAPAEVVTAPAAMTPISACPPEWSVLTNRYPVAGCLNNTCAPPARAWARLEYLNWKADGGRLPVLATTSPPGTPAAIAGVPGAPGTTVLFGGSKYLDDRRGGYRVTVGGWVTDDQTIGVEASYLSLDGKSVGFSAASAGLPILASSPFVDATTGDPRRVLIAFPGIVSGSTSVDYQANRLEAFGLYARAMLTSGDGWRLDGLAGYRHIEYGERLTIRKTLFPGFPAVDGTRILCDDGWEADTKFHGFALGLDLEKCCGDWSFIARPMVTIGQAQTTVTRSGITTVAVPGEPTVVLPGGTYNLNSNLGRLTTRGVTAVPELDLQIARQFGNHVRITAGYSLLYLPLVARAGDQLDQRVNVDLIPPALPTTGPLLPAAFVNRTSMLFHGVTVGIELRY